MASFQRLVLFGALLAAFVTIGNCSSQRCYQGRGGASFNRKDFIETNCTDKSHVCARIEYVLEKKTIVFRDCVSAKHVSEKLSGDREVLKKESSDYKTEPVVKQVATCDAKLCNAAPGQGPAWALALVATTSALALALAASR